MPSSRWIHLANPSDLAVLDADLVRGAMLANARLATNDSAGRNQGDTLFEEITEGRQRCRGYSSCGDLIHWCLRRIGLRDERILNREDDQGDVTWRVSRNISLLRTGAAVIGFQRVHGLVPDGIVGPKTRGAMREVMGTGGG